MNKKILLSTVTATVLAVGFSGCMGNPYQVTPEQQQQAMQYQQEAMAKMQQMFGNKLPNLNNQNTQAEEKAAPVVQIPVITQDELKAKIDAFGISNGTVNFEKIKAGININGKPYSDYEGIIKQVNYNNINGYVTYLVQISPNLYNMKFFQATSNLEPLTVATVKFEDGTWQVASITGKKLSGDTLILGSSGFAITRTDGSGFTYEHATGIKSINIPSGYQVAKFQNGDIVGTKTILLEIPEATNDDGNNGATTGFNAVWNKTKSLGAALGIGKKEDYAFLNLDNGNLSKINISSEGKTTMKCLQYDPKGYNKVVKKCLKYDDPVESIYSVKDGSRNTKHYYWLITWLNTKSGVIGLTQEKGLSDIFATNLTTGKKVLLTSRSLGYEKFDYELQSNGKINLIASNGVFGSDVVEDIELKIETLPAVEQEKEEK